MLIFVYGYIIKSKSIFPLDDQSQTSYIMCQAYVGANPSSAREKCSLRGDHAAFKKNDMRFFSKVVKTAVSVTAYSGINTYIKRSFDLKEAIKMTYGYCRISTPKQSIERQIRNIAAAYPHAVIVQEYLASTEK